MVERESSQRQPNATLACSRLDSMQARRIAGAGLVELPEVVSRIDNGLREARVVKRQPGGD
jgi:hypothetical protein